MKCNYTDALSGVDSECESVWDLIVFQVHQVSDFCVSEMSAVTNSTTMFRMIAHTQGQSLQQRA